MNRKTVEKGQDDSFGGRARDNRTTEEQRGACTASSHKRTTIQTQIIQHHNKLLTIRNRFVGHPSENLAIKHAILLLIQGVRDPSLPSLWGVPGRLCRAFCSQQCIGYQGLLEGRLSCQWAPCRKNTYSYMGGSSPTLWVSHLSHQLILMGFQMWEHWNLVQHLEDNVQLREHSRQVNDGIHSQFDMGPTNLPKVAWCMLLVKRRAVLNKPSVDWEEWQKLVKTHGLLPCSGASMPHSPSLCPS